MKQPGLDFCTVDMGGGENPAWYVDVRGEVPAFSDDAVTVAAGRTKSRALRKASKVLAKMARDLKKEAARAALEGLE